MRKLRAIYLSGLFLFPFFAQGVTSNFVSIYYLEDLDLAGAKFYKRIGFISTPYEYCTALLYRDDVIITAAHCVTERENNNEIARALDPSRTSKIYISGKYLQLKQIRIHPGYNPNDRRTPDLALVHVERSGSILAPPLEIPQKDKLQIGDVFIATGLCTPGNSYPDVSWGFVQLADYARTFGQFTFSGGFFNTVICKNDSGGPVVRWDGEQFYLHSINSLSDGISSKGPSLVAFRNWIEDTIKELRGTP